MHPSPIKGQSFRLEIPIICVWSELLWCPIAVHAKRAQMTTKKTPKALNPTLSPAEILIQFEKYPSWYWRQMQNNTQRKQDNLTRDFHQTLGIVNDQSLSYAVIPKLEDYLNVNFYVVSSALSFLTSVKTAIRREKKYFHITWRRNLSIFTPSPKSVAFFRLPISVQCV